MLVTYFQVRLTERKLCAQAQLQIYTHIHTHIHTRIHTRIHPRIHTRIRTCIRTRIHTGFMTMMTGGIDTARLFLPDRRTIVTVNNAKVHALMLTYAIPCPSHAHTTKIAN